MATPNNELKPKDQKIDKRTIALGAVGFSLLAIILFALGMFCIGPMMHSKTQTAEEYKPAPSYSPPPRPAEPAKDPEPSLDVEVTELTGDTESDTPEAETPDVTQDGNTLTIKVDSPVSEKTPESRTPAPDPVPEARPARPGTHTTETARPAPAPEHTAAPTSKGITYRVQAGTFAERRNADQLVADLKAKGYKPEIVTTHVENHALHRVQIGKFKTQEDARELANDLDDQGFSPSVVQIK